jgi:hypothetical protein
MSLFRANFKKRFVSGHDFSRAVNEANDEGFSPCGSLSLSVRLGDHSAFQSTGRTLPLQESIAVPYKMESMGLQRLRES